MFLMLLFYNCFVYLLLLIFYNGFAENPLMYIAIFFF